MVNRDIRKPMPLRVAFDPAAGVRAAAKDGTLAPVTDAAYAGAVEPGDVAVFAWAAAK